MKHEQSPGEKAKKALRSLAESIRRPRHDDWGPGKFREGMLAAMIVLSIALALIGAGKSAGAAMTYGAGAAQERSRS
jgi:hypothetical protein